MAAGATYFPIATTTLSSAQATVTFTSITGAYTDIILIAANTGNADNLANAYVRFNSDTGSNYSYTFIQGNGSTASSSRGSNENYMNILRSFGGDNTMNIVQIQNYSNTTTYKTALSRYGSGGSSSATLAGVGLWRNTNAITSITIGITDGFNFLSGAMFTIYGIEYA